MHILKSGVGMTGLCVAAVIPSECIGGDRRLIIRAAHDLLLVLLIGVSLLVQPAAAYGAAFNQNDLSHLSDLHASLQSLKQDVTASVKSFSPSNVEMIKSYAHLEVTLEAVQERLNAVYIVVAISEAMETSNDQTRVLNALPDLLVQTKIYLGAKRRGIIGIATTEPSGGMFASYSIQATGIIDKALPLVDEYYARLNVVQRRR